MGKLNLRTRDDYCYSKADLNRRQLRKMQADLIIFKYLSEQEEFKDAKTIYAPGSVIMVNGKEKVLETYFIDYDVFLRVIGCDVEGIINREVKQTFDCPHNEKFCRSLLKNMGKGRPALDKEKIEQIRELFREGRGIREIARLVSVAPSVVHKYVGEEVVQ